MGSSKIQNLWASTFLIWGRKASRRKPHFWVSQFFLLLAVNIRKTPILLRWNLTSTPRRDPRNKTPQELRFQWNPRSSSNTHPALTTEAKTFLWEPYFTKYSLQECVSAVIKKAIIFLVDLDVRVKTRKEGILQPKPVPLHNTIDLSIIRSQSCRPTKRSWCFDEETSCRGRSPHAH